MTRHPLPSQPSPLIGCEDELAGATARLTDLACRLLTIVGLGGVGKTRLAIEATRTVDTFTDGVYFVDLQAVEPPDFLAVLAEAAFHRRRTASFDATMTPMNACWAAARGDSGG